MIEEFEDLPEDEEVLFVCILALINALLNKGLHYKLESTRRINIDQQIRVEGSVGLLCCVLRQDILTVPLSILCHVDD